MVVHAHDARHDGVAPQVEDGEAIARVLVRAGGYGRYPAGVDVDVAIPSRRGAGAVDHFDMFENDSGRAHAQVRAYLRAEMVGGLRAASPKRGQRRRADECNYPLDAIRALSGRHLT